ncbi:MAG: DUF4446 family protein [Symbiobacteriaceae bacterium]|nr:DUF4446 family protein [Symbiobacteriaceae bacterium]
MNSLLEFVRDNFERLVPVVFACGIFVLLSLLTLAFALWRLFSGLRTYRLISESFASGDTIAQLAKLLELSEQLDERLTVAEKHNSLQDQKLQSQSTHLQEVVQQVGLVRYNAFPDVAGDQSYSLALLNTLGDGVVLTTLHGRAEARTYAKKVVHGASNYPLLPEEQQAIFQALQGARSPVGRPKTPATPGRVTTPEVTLQERAYLLGRAEEMRNFSQDSNSISAPAVSAPQSTPPEPREGWGEYTRIISEEEPPLPPATTLVAEPFISPRTSLMVEPPTSVQLQPLPELAALFTIEDPVNSEVSEEAMPEETEVEEGWPAGEDLPPPWMRTGIALVSEEELSTADRSSADTTLSDNEESNSVTEPPQEGSGATDPERK